MFSTAFNQAVVSDNAEGAAFIRTAKLFMFSKN